MQIKWVKAGLKVFFVEVGEKDDDISKMYSEGKVETGRVKVLIYEMSKKSDNNVLLGDNSFLLY